MHFLGDYKNTFLRTLLLLICAALTGTALAQEAVDIGADGVSGIDGADGDPGVSGTDGEDGDSGFVDLVALAVDQTIFAIGRGGDGGRGGSGGDGSGPTANGGDGGSGGNGGDATVSALIDAAGFGVTLNVNADGGRGSEGGQPGTGSGNAAGGNGGNGGSADGYGEVTATDLNGFNLTRVSVFSSGDSGASGYGPNAAGGNGGDATGGGRIQADGGSRSTLELDVFAGNGGRGINGADGGHGGVASLGEVSNNVEGPGGMGTSFASVFGGNGGSAQLTGNAGNGSSIELVNAVQAYANFSASIRQHAIAGDSGDVEEGVNGTAGNAVSNMSLLNDPVDISLDSELFVDLEAQAGNGGDRDAISGAAAFGADALSEADMVTARRSASLSSLAQGGNGGWSSQGALAGDAGDAVATSTLDQNYAPSGLAPGSGATSAIATGGSAGVQFDGVLQDALTGGDAMAQSVTESQGVSGASSSANAVAGAGGGVAGNASGNGGNGGLAVADARTVASGDVSAAVRVIGGRGGSASGAGYRAGDGTVGIATVFAESTDNGSVSVTSNQRGGAGGSAVNDAAAGNGASIFLVNSAVGVTEGDLSLEQEARGGLAGSSVASAGDAGTAGEASVTSSGDFNNTSLFIRDTATGGRGGNGNSGAIPTAGGNAVLNLDVSNTGSVVAVLSGVGGAGGNTSVNDKGSRGGNAILERATVTAQDSVQLSIYLEGGEAGGSGANNSGGSVVINGPVVAESLQGGDVSVELRAVGGDARTVTTTSAQSVSLVNAISATTSGNLLLAQTAEAGNAEEGPVDPLEYVAPDALSELSHSSDSESLTVNATTRGGDGADGAASMGYTGGDAASLAVAENASGSVVAEANSTAGRGGNNFFSDGNSGGAGGVASSVATARALGDTASATAMGTALGGTGGQSDFGGFGGNAISQSVAIASGSGRAVATDTATGGFAFGSDPLFNTGGDASSAAQASSQGEAVARAIATGGSATIGLSNGANGINGTGTAVATATSEFDHASAFSSAFSGFGTGANPNPGIQFGEATATSEASGQTSDSEARALVGSSGLVREANAIADSVNDGTSMAVASLNSGVVSVEQTQAVTQGSSTLAVVLPDADSVTALLADTAVVIEDFDPEGESEMLAYVNMGAGFLTENNAGTGLASSHLDFEINTDYLETDQSLLLGLLGSTIGDSGFDELRFRVQVEAQLLVDETFTSSEEAAAYFADQTIDLGMWTDLLAFDNVLEFSIDLEVTASMAGMGFQFDALLGNSTIDIAAVPLPAAFWFLLSALGVLVRQRKVVVR